MNDTQNRLLQLAKQRDITDMGLRELAKELDVKNPQTIKYHLQKLQQTGLIDTAKPAVQIRRGMLGLADLVRIPIRGTVSAGPATQLATNDVSGYVRVSSNLLKTRNFKDLFALRVVGTSMNRASVQGKPVNDGDYAIVDSSKRSPRDGEYVIAVVDDLANIKKFHFDHDNEQIVLLSESLEDYLPIFVHPDDEREGLISGTVVQVITMPNSKNASH